MLKDTEECFWTAINMATMPSIFFFEISRSTGSHIRICKSQSTAFCIHLNDLPPRNIIHIEHHISLTNHYQTSTMVSFTYAFARNMPSPILLLTDNSQIAAVATVCAGMSRALVAKPFKPRVAGTACCDNI